MFFFECSIEIHTNFPFFAIKKVENTTLFESYLQKSRLSINTSDDINELINDSLKICQFLNVSIPFSEYMERHGKCLSFLGLLLQKLSDRQKFSEQVLNEYFYKVLNYNKIIARLYICFLIACAIPDTGKIMTCCEMAYCIGNPLRGFMLRNYYLTFFPRDIPEISEFGLINFGEMIRMIIPAIGSEIENLDPTLRYLSQNITLSLESLPEMNSKRLALIRSFAGYAMQTSSHVIGLSIFTTIIHSITVLEFPKVLNFFLPYFDELPRSDKAISCLKLLISKVNNPFIFFNFISKNHFAIDLAPKLIEQAVSMNSIETLQLCAEKWINHEDILTFLLTEAGPSLFYQICPPLDPSSKLLLVLIDNLSPQIPLKYFLNVFSNLLNERSKEIDNYLLQKVKSFNDLSYQFHIFLPPFIIQSNLMFDYVVQFFLNMNETEFTPNFKEILPIFSASKSKVQTETRIRKLIPIWPQTEPIGAFIEMLHEEKDVPCIEEVLNFLKSRNAQRRDYIKISEMSKSSKCIFEIFKFIINNQEFTNDESLIKEIFEHLFFVAECCMSNNKKGAISLLLKTAVLVKDKEMAIDSQIEEGFVLIQKILDITHQYPQFPISTDKTRMKWRSFIDELMTSHCFHSSEPVFNFIIKNL